MSNSDEIYMRRCLELAAKAKGLVAPNPMVGCIIVYENNIISEGYHQKYGDKHAEVNAIEGIYNKNIINKSTLFVNLEPCSHHGKTPPCADLIIRKGFKKVVIGALDNNSLVAGKGIEKLQKAGIEVICGVIENECKTLNKTFYTYHEKKRPFYTLKWAETTDGYLFSESNNPKISNELSAQKVHQLRAEHQAILIGKNTLIQDNPLLNVRHVKGNNPLKIIVVNEFKDEYLQLKLFKDGQKTLVFNTSKSEIKDNLELVKFNPSELITKINRVLYAKNIQSVLVEGGTNVLEQFISSNNWDELIQIIGKQIFKKGIKSPSLELKPIFSNSVGGDIWNYFENQLTEN